MSWASRRRTTYLTGVVVFFAAVVGGPVAYWYFSIPATCSDGIQNQGETGVDVGGPCPLLDPHSLQPQATLWSRAFKVRDGTYSAVASIQNSNQNAGIARAHYRFTFYDTQNILVAEREGDSFIMPGAVTPIFESRIDAGNRIVAHTYFEFTGALTWERMVNAANTLAVDNKQFSDTERVPRLSAEARNNGAVDMIAPAFIAVVYDSVGNAIAASETRLDRLDAGASSPIVFTWPEPFAAHIGRVDITPVVPPSPAFAQ